MFKIESVEREFLYVCNLFDEGFQTETEVKKHLQSIHEAILQNITKEKNDKEVNLDESDIYEGFDEDGNRIAETDSP